MKKIVFLFIALSLIICSCSGSLLETDNSSSEKSSNPVQLNEEQLNAAQKLYKEFIENGSIIELPAENNDNSDVQEILFANEEAQLKFDAALKNSIGIEPVESETTSEINPLKNDSTRELASSRRIKIHGRIKRRHKGVYCEYKGWTTTTYYTPSKIKVTIWHPRISWKKKSATKKNTRKVGVKVKEYGFPYAPKRGLKGKHECWYNFGKGYLKIYTSL